MYSLFLLRMSKPTPIDTFDILYGICSQDGREAALFGDSVALVRPVIEKCITGDNYPLFYVEFPLKGTPCFDVLTVHSEISPGTKFAPGCGFGYQVFLLDTGQAVPLKWIQAEAKQNMPEFISSSGTKQNSLRRS